MKNRNLYVAATPFQLMNIINIKIKLFNEVDSDLVICKNSVLDYNNIIKKLKKKQVFKNIFLYNGDDLRIKVLINKKYNLKKYVNLNYKKYVYQLDVNDFISNDKIYFENYDNIFCVDKEFTKYIKGEGFKVFLFDEGLGTYINNAVKNRVRIDGIFLYRPIIAEYYEEYKDIIFEIPLVSIYDNNLKNILNYIFGLDENNLSEYKKIIYFDQPWKKVPRRFINIMYSNFGFYKNSVSELKIQEFNIKFIKWLQIRGYEYIVKLHPRALNHTIVEYMNLNINITNKNSHIPWEVVFLNLAHNEYLFLSIYSTASYTPYIVFDKSLKCKTIMLYKMVDEKYIDDSIDEFFNKIKRICGNIYIVDKIEDMEDIINDV